MRDTETAEQPGERQLLESVAKLLERCGPHLQGVEKECCGCPVYGHPEEPPECCGQPIDLSDLVSNELRCIRATLSAAPPLTQSEHAVIWAAKAWGDADADDPIAMLAAELGLSDALSALAGAPAPIQPQPSDDLHQQIMNLPCKFEAAWRAPAPSDWVEGYVNGHRDTRHAAAELVSAAAAAQLAASGRAR